MDDTNKLLSESEINAEADRLGAKGVLMAEVIRDTREGPKVIARSCAFNTVFNTGKQATWRVAAGINSNNWDQGRIGTSSQAITSAQTNLTTPVTGTLHTVSVKTLSGRTLQLVWSYASGAGTKSATIKEAVILNQNTSPGGSALCRVLLSPTVTKTTADKLKLTYQVRIT